MSSRRRVCGRARMGPHDLEVVTFMRSRFVANVPDVRPRAHRPTIRAAARGARGAPYDRRITWYFFMVPVITGNYGVV